MSGLLLTLPFFSFPWLTNPNATAKAYWLYFCVISLLVFELSRAKKLYLDSSICLGGGFVVALCISTSLNGNPASAWQFVGMAAVAWGFFYLTACWNQRCTDAITVVMKVLLSVAVLFALLGLGQGIDFLVNGRRAGMLIPYLLPGTWGLRISGPFGQPNFHALLMTAGLCSFTYVYFKEVWGKRSKWVQGGGLLLALLLLVNFFQTDSRGGQIAFTIVAISLLWIKSRHPEFFPSHLGWKPFALLTGLVLIAYSFRRLLLLFLFDPSLVSGHHVAQSYSITSRINMWLSSLLMAYDNPLFGFGPDSFKKYLFEYQLKALEILRFEYEDLSYTRWAHNEYLQVLAEGGTISFCLLILFLCVSITKIIKKIKNKNDQYTIFAFLSLIPFFVQASFSWPLRFSPLLAIFLAILATLLPKEQFLTIELGKYSRFFLIFSCGALFYCGGWSLISDLRVSNLSHDISNKDNVVEEFTQYSTLSEGFFAETELVTQGIIPFVRYAVREKDKDLAIKLIPFLERGVNVRGDYWLWYNLARVLFVAGDENRSKTAILKCIDLNPLFGPGWAFRHYLDVVEAARQTGRTIESFYPKNTPKLGLDYDSAVFLQHQ
ncbi:O-antigen ligase family protein [Desulfuromonas versatilis]|uniref:O-antigen ligase family protein n=1 Tax=Desulfuromonas versatilis TaxID=2802975 RepID=UPI001C85CD32|nr:O-antigen ligase family protein [Desulfuromonas versatilis]